jgi:hypothetical protein
MNYLRIYDSIIDRANIRKQSNNRPDYIERHHIVPKCMGGSNNSPNISELTAEEHYVCHQLLVKIYPTNIKLIFACKAMCMSKKGLVRNNKMYGWIRKLNARASSELNKGRPCKFKGKPSGRKGVPNPLISLIKKGIPKTAEHNKKNSEAQLGSKNHRFSKPAHNRGIESPLKGIPTGPALKAYKCEHCALNVVKVNYNRWHGPMCDKQMFNYG